jgi:hypothetical protein
VFNALTTQETGRCACRSRSWRCSCGDPHVSESIREVILAAITVPARAGLLSGAPDRAPSIERIAMHGTAPRELLTEAADVLSPAER